MGAGDDVSGLEEAGDVLGAGGAPIGANGVIGAGSPGLEAVGGNEESGLLELAGGVEAVEGVEASGVLAVGVTASGVPAAGVVPGELVVVVAEASVGAVPVPGVGGRVAPSGDEATPPGVAIGSLGRVVSAGSVEGGGG
jgi:hypothetical protein